MSCVHCGSDATRNERPDALTHEQWIQVIDDLKTLGNKSVTLSGGEPFLYPRWRDLVLHIRKRKMRANFISNGYFIREEDIVFMKENGVTHVAVSVDGDEAVHDAIRRFPGSFARLLEVFTLGKKHTFPVTVVTSVNKRNFGVREKIREIMLEHGVVQWQVQIVNSFGRAGEKRDELLLDPDQYIELCDDILRWRRAHAGVLRVDPADSMGYCHPVTDEFLGDCEWRGCNAGMYVVGVQADGAVLGCLSLQDEKFIAGNVRERSLVDIWNDEAAFSYTRGYDVRLMEGACGTCDTKRRCKSGCLGIAWSIEGSLYRNPYCYKSIMAARDSAAPVDACPG